MMANQNTPKLHVITQVNHVESYFMRYSALTVQSHDDRGVGTLLVKRMLSRASEAGFPTNRPGSDKIRA